jgi:acetyl-CoA synthetase
VFVYDYRGKFDPASLLRVMSKGGVTSFCAPPTLYRFLVREDLSAYDLSALRHCTTAGELLNASVFEEWKKLTGLNIYEGYGQTESTLQIVTLPCMEPKPGSIGKPAPGWDIQLLLPDGSPCPAGEEGEICVGLAKGSPSGLFDGYLDEPERTAAVVYNGAYHTGDKAWMDEDGYYWFLGRVDDLIKSSGYRIGPFEVESALVAHDAVIEAAVTGLPDPVRGQIVKATVVLASGFEPSPELTRELQEHVKRYTAPYKYPRRIDYVKELPKTISGKIRRSVIREEDAQKV